MSFEMIQKSVAIAFLARDCEKSLPVFLNKIEQLRSFFKKSSVYIVENGSRDATRSLLQRYSNLHDTVTLKTFDDPEFDLRARIEKMVFLRNLCLDMVKESDNAPDYYIVIDGDLDFEVVSVIGALRDAPKDWAALFANGRYFLKLGRVRIPVLYYDLFAFLPYEYGTCNKYALTEPEILSLRPVIQQALKKKRYVKCQSAFAGVGIYRYEAIRECCYSLEENDVSRKFEHLCEHIPFNREVSKKGSLYICRDMKVYYERISFKEWLRAKANEKNAIKE